MSSFDPTKEAIVWAEKALTDLGDHDSLIVLGAACGYHIVALRRLRPSLSILTIEASAEIANFASEVFASQPEVDAAYFGSVLVALKPSVLTESLVLRDFMGGRFAVVTHPVLAQQRPEWTREVAQFLTGRDYLSFLLQLRMRPELHALFDEEKIATLSSSGTPLSILTIRTLFSAQSQTSRERRIWRVLEELIV